MSKSEHERFLKLFQEDKLLSPDEPAYIISSLINCNKNDIRELNGEFISRDDNRLNKFIKK